MVSFEAKICWKRPRKRENENYRFVSFLPNAQQKIPNKQKKIQKIRRIPFWRHLKQKQIEKCQEREKIKIIVLFRSYTTRNRKFQKNSKKIQKVRRSPFWLHLKQKQVAKCQEREKIKIIVLFHSYTTRNRKFQKNSKKL